MLMNMTKSKGQGLIEVMMTVLLITGCVLALARFQNYLAYSNSLANQQLTATQLALSKIESLRDYSVLTGSNSYANIASGTSTTTGTTATYTLTWTVTSNTNPTYDIIDITVSWTDRYGTSQSVRLISRVSSLDPANSATIMTL